MMLKFKAMANIIMSPKSLERPRLARDQGSARGCPVSRFSMFCLEEVWMRQRAENRCEQHWTHIHDNTLTTLDNGPA